jgi:non-homologous end joining protein Ku
MGEVMRVLATKAPVAVILVLTRELIRASTAKRFDLAKYQDVYTEKLKRLIEAKVAGQEIVAQPVHEPAPIINLMDALKASLANAQGEKPPKKMAPSEGKEKRGGKRKSL